MLFDSTVRQEVGRSFAATLVVILTVVITYMLIRTLGQAAGGAVAPQDVVLLLGYTSFGYLPLVLSLSLFVSVVVVLGRMYRDSEMAVWFACGLGLHRFIRPVLWTALPVWLVIGVATLWVWPWVNERSVELRERYQQRSDLSRVTPGVFQTSADGQRVFFIERDSPDGWVARNVFILDDNPRVESVTSARMGHIESTPEGKFLVLEHGQRSETRLSTQVHTAARFDTYRVLVDDKRVQTAQERPPKAMASMDLMRSHQSIHHAELTWRVGLLLSAGNLLLLGIGLASTNPRRPSNWNLIFALLTFIIYLNLVNLSQGWVATQRLSMGAALAWIHGLVFLMALCLLYWRDFGIVWTSRWFYKARP
ncbi:MAG: hypothetical protein RI949_1347 [Pseudomonadota bacterium]